MGLMSSVPVMTVLTRAHSSPGSRSLASWRSARNVARATFRGVWHSSEEAWAYIREDPKSDLTDSNSSWPLRNKGAFLRRPKMRRTSHPPASPVARRSSKRVEIKLGSPIMAVSPCFFAVLSGSSYAPAGHH